VNRKENFSEDTSVRQQHNLGSADMVTFWRGFGLRRAGREGGGELLRRGKNRSGISQDNWKSDAREDFLERGGMQKRGADFEFWNTGRDMAKQKGLLG